jgi:hypothetical protein
VVLALDLWILYRVSLFTSIIFLEVAFFAL